MKRINWNRVFIFPIILLFFVFADMREKQATHVFVVGKVVDLTVADNKEVSSGIKCLAENIYHEARGESIKGMYAVAHVTANRVKDGSWGNSLCAVIKQPYQFSWTRMRLAAMPKTGATVQTAYTVATHVVNGEVSDPTNGATHFHANYIEKPDWTKSMKVSAVIGNHIFYKRS